MKLLFIPGSGSGRKAWVYQTEYFIGSEAVALPGHPDGEPCTSVADYVEWLRDYIHQHQYQDVILVGHSLGGAIVQLYGLKYGEDVKALVLIGTGARLRVLPAALEAVKGAITDEAAWQKYLEDDISSIIDHKVRRALIEEIAQIGPAVMLNDYLCCDKFDIMDEVHTIKLPTLAICGSEDRKTPVKYTKYLAYKIEGATYVVIEGTSHWGHMEKPREVNQAIEEFLGSLS